MRGFLAGAFLLVLAFYPPAEALQCQQVIHQPGRLVERATFERQVPPVAVFIPGAFQEFVNLPGDFEVI
jgi:hypothetical protein